MCIAVSTPSLKNTTPFFLANPPLNQQTVQAPLFRQSSPRILIFREAPPPLKSWIFFRMLAVLETENLYVYIYIIIVINITMVVILTVIAINFTISFFIVILGRCLSNQKLNL